MASRLRCAWPLVVAGALAGCPKETAVWVEAGSTVEQLRFRTAKRRGGTEPVAVGVFRVDRCGAWAEAAPERPTPMWGAGLSQEVERIDYGVMPPGAQRLIGQADTALTLTPGCYEATTSGTGRTSFDVAADGRILEREQR